MTTLPTLILPRYLPQANTKEKADIEVTYELADEETFSGTKYILVEVFCKDICLTEIVSDKWLTRITQEVCDILDTQERDRRSEQRELNNRKL